MPPRPKLPENMLTLTEDLTVPALGEAEITRLRRLVDVSPEEFKRVAGQVMQRLVVEGFATLQAPRNWKEQATAIDLWRKFTDQDKQAKDGGMPPGLVGVLRSVNRRVVEAEPADESVGFE